MHAIILSAFLLLALPMTWSLAHAGETERFAIYYSDKAPLEDFKPYQTLVLDSTYHPPLQPLKESGKTLLGYISIGEAEKRNVYFRQLERNRMLVGENKNWANSFKIDLRNTLWIKMIIEDIIPPLIRQGFDGVFLDTLDSPLDLERVDSRKYKGMGSAGVDLVKAIRMHYPNLKIMINRAYEILPQVAPFIDMELGESVYADYNFDKKTYGKVGINDYNQQVIWLQRAKQINPRLKIYTLDYAEPRDRDAILDIYRTERANGFIPYVATIKLDQLIKEPGVM